MLELYDLIAILYGIIFMEDVEPLLSLASQHLELKF